MASNMKILGDFQVSVRRALTEIDPNWESYPGLIVCGSHTPKDPESIIEKIKENREANLPYLGICYGEQLAAIEYARNELGVKDATSEEWGKGTFVVNKRSELKVGLREGESWWSYFQAQAYYYPKNYFVAPYHPEYQSWKGHPHPLLVNFLKYASKS